MAAALATPAILHGTDSPWGTFEDVRDHLFDQWLNVPFLSDTGLSVDALRDEVDEYLHEHVDLPRVLRRAHAYRIVVTRAQISVDPLDWFAGKLNHGGILPRNPGAVAAGGTVEHNRVRGAVVSTGGVAGRGPCGDRPGPCLPRLGEYVSRRTCRPCRTGR